MNLRNSSSRNRHKFHRTILIGIAVAGAILATVLIVARITSPSPRALSYGQFRKLLVDGKVATAKIGTTSIEGRLQAADAHGGSIFYHVSRVGMEHDHDLIRLLDTHIVNGAYEAEAVPSLLQTVGLPAMLAVLMLAAFIWMSTRSGAMGSTLAFARSRPRVYSADENRVTFDDVAGHDEVVAELRELVGFLKSPEKFRSLGGRIPKGVLLVGPPGTGKTLMARAVAGEAGVPFYSLSGSDFVELFVGVGASRVRNLFARAASKNPCLIFIDELDAMGKSRGAGGHGGHDERDQTLNQLLVEMDGFDSNRGIILLAATNRPETLDPALVRPGRFDRQVVVDRPDLVGREEILRVHTQTVPLDTSINLRHVAALTSGFVGADLANLVNEAALLTARHGKSRVGLSEFEEGIERLIAGPQKRQRVLSHAEKVRIAYHEAGHALVSHSLPETDPVRKVSIIGRGTAALGYTLYRPESDRYLHTRTSLENVICCLLGGTLAEELGLGEPSDGCTNDLQRVTQIARKMVTQFGMGEGTGRLNFQSDDGSSGVESPRWSEQTAREIDLEIRRIVSQAQERTRAILNARRTTLDRIVHCLLDRETIDSDDLQRLMTRTDEPA